MLCVWWNFEDIIHFELVQNDRSIDSHLYAEKTDRVYSLLLNHYPALVTRKCYHYQHDNTPAHLSRIVKQNLKFTNYRQYRINVFLNMVGTSPIFYKSYVLQFLKTEV